MCETHYKIVRINNFLTLFSVNMKEELGTQWLIYMN